MICNNDLLISNDNYLDDKLLNNIQKEIIYDTEFLSQQQALCIIACAGSGKTTTIINKVIYMIEILNCNPEEFILTTFTRNATEEIIKRLSKHLDKNIINKLTIGTFHSIALRQIIQNNYQIEDNKPESIPEEYLIKYIELLNNNKSNYKYIFVDEYQDINQLQYDIINKWFEYADLLTVVGDEQQNIYTFRNTSIKYILNFCEDFNNAEYKYLTINYRCNPGIVNFTNAIISFNSDKIEKQILSGSMNEIKKPKIRFFQNDQNEKEYIHEYILKIQKYNKNASIAILSRTNKKLYKIENFLALHNIKTKMLDAELKNDSNNIILSTIHGSKGLEFDYVIIINCIDGSFPIVGADVQEERRLFYVACTRAKEELLITSMWFDKFKPSRFIYELYNLDKNIADFVSFEWSNPIYDNLLSKRTNILSNMIYNLDICTFMDLKNKQILPPDEYLNFKLINIHSNINFDEIIEYPNLTDLNIIGSNMLDLQLYRIILEIVLETEYVYLPYIKNDQIFKNTRYSFKQAIKNNNESQLNKHNDYFIKLNSEFIMPKSKKILLNIFNLISDSEFITVDFNNITKDNKAILTESYIKFQNKDISSIDLIDDIFNLSIINELIKGRYSLQLILNNINFKDKTILIDHLDKINEWLKSNIILTEYVDYNYDVIINNFIFGKIDLILDNRMIIINSSTNNKPSINDYIKYIILFIKYNIDNKNINKLTHIQYYNPLLGNIYEWDLTDFVIQHELNFDNIIDHFISLING